MPLFRNHIFARRLYVLMLLLVSSQSDANAQNFAQPGYGAPPQPQYYAPQYPAYQPGYAAPPQPQYYAPQYPSYQSGFGAPPQPQYSAPQYAPANNYPQSYQPHTTMNSLEGELDRLDSNWHQVPPSQPTTSMSPRRHASASSGPVMRSWQGMFPGVSKQELMRVFLEGGTPQGFGSQSSVSAPSEDKSGQYASARSSTYSNYQTACAEARRARTYANTAHYNHDKWTRKNSASRAYYAANNADYAASRAESAARSGDAQAQHYAGMARQEARRARQSANEARYNADTIQ